MGTEESWDTVLTREGGGEVGDPMGWEESGRVVGVVGVRETLGVGDVHVLAP